MKKKKIAKVLWTIISLIVVVSMLAWTFSSMFY